MQDNPGASLEDITKKIKDGEATVNIFGKTIKAPGFLFNEDDITAAYDRALSGPVSDFEADVETEGPTRRGTLIGTDKEGKITDDVAPGSAKSLNLTDDENEAIRKAAEEAVEKARVQKMLQEADKEKARRQAVAEEAEKRKASAEEKQKIARENAIRDAEAKAKRMAEAAARRKAAREQEKDDRDKNRDKSKKSSCFSPTSEFKMADGTIKQIKDIKIGDVVELGGKVSMVMQGDGSTAKWYTYGSTKVTSTHAVYENDNWTRVGIAKQSVLMDTIEPTLITLVNENHRLVAKDGVIFTDYDEVDNTGIEDDLLLELNKS